jgi:ectoine hydroxylase-related dioxygenase (phytanoyl-CoA dioxygenase family)
MSSLGGGRTAAQGENKRRKFMLTNEQIQQYRRSGFVNGGPVLDDATVETLQREVLRVIEERDKSDVPQPVRVANLSSDAEHPIWQIVNIWQASPAFQALSCNPKIGGMAAELSGASELRIWHDQIQYKPKELGGRLHWHQDSPLWATLQPKDGQLTAWVALDDAEADNGCMYMIPGSHLWGNKQKDLDKLPQGIDLPEAFEGHPLHFIMCPVKKGHVHFHHSLTWHGSGQNHSSRPRRAIAIHFMTERTTYDASGSHIMQPFITVPSGERLQGDAFPLVWTKK